MCTFSLPLWHQMSSVKNIIVDIVLCFNCGFLLHCMKYDIPIMQKSDYHSVLFILTVC